MKNFYKFQNMKNRKNQLKMLKEVILKKEMLLLKKMNMVILYIIQKIGFIKQKKRVVYRKKEVPGKDIKKDDLIGVDCFLKGKLRDETVIARSDDVKVVGLSLDEFVDVEDIMRRKYKIFTQKFLHQYQILILFFLYLI